VSKRISKRVREEAAVLASVLACDISPHGAWWTPYGGASKEAYQLWGRAFDFVSDAYGDAFDHDTMKNQASAEAEALLRTGWTP
jgi:hypothetical protein